MNKSIYVLKKYTENFDDRVEELIAASFDLITLEELLVKLENKVPDIPEVVWRKFRRYALKKDPYLDEIPYGIAIYTHEHSRDKYTLEQLKEAEDFYESDYYKDTYIIVEIPFIDQQPIENA